MKKKIVMIIMAMAFSLCVTACGEAESKNGDVSTTVVDETDMGMENTSAEQEYQEDISVILEGENVQILIENEALTALSGDNGEVWIRFYDDETRQTGIDITVRKDNYDITPIGSSDILSNGVTDGAFIDENMLIISFNDEYVLGQIARSNLYEVIVKDWDNDSKSGMILDGESKKIEGIKRYTVTYLNSDNTVDQADNTNISNSDSSSKNDISSNNYYLERQFTDGISTICFHGTNPTHPTSMTINGKKITFDKVDLVENDDYYMHISLGWEYEGYNEGAMYYDKEADYMQLKGFAIANDYYPVNSSSNASSSSTSFVGVPYTGTYGTIVVEAVDSDGIPTKMAFDDYHVTFTSRNVTTNDSGLICAQCFWDGDDGRERQCEFNYLVPDDMIILKMYYEGEYTR